MPSAYTAPIQDGISFDAFVMRCARAMGACVMMRDERMDAPIPERFEPSDYNAKKLSEAEQRLAWLRQIPAQEAEREAKREYDEDVKRNAKGIQKAIDLRNKYQAMIADVVAWNPPTSEHIGLKNFMLQQLHESLRYDADESYYRDHAPVLLSAEAWKAQQIEKCLRDIDYHKKAAAEEVDRTEQRNLWIADLRKSLATGESQ
jgi:hypothetical protein